MSDVDIAYAAGLFEGEGSVHTIDYYYVNKEKRKRKTPQIKLQISMVDREPLEKFSEIFGGKIYGPYNPTKYGHPEHHSEIWTYSSGNQNRIIEALRCMYPYLSPRRQSKIDEVISKRGENH